MYVVGQTTGAQQTRVVYALRANNGAVEWQAAVSNPEEITATDSMVYASSNNHVLTALQASNGATIWQYQTSSEDINCLIVSQGNIYACGTDASLFALNAGIQTF